MNFLKKIIGSKPEATPDEEDFAQGIKEMARGEDEAARNDDGSGLVALYPELSKRRTRKRGFADLDFDEYVPELDDYEPGQEGEFVSENGDASMEERLAQVRARLQEDIKNKPEMPKTVFEPESALTQDPEPMIAVDSAAHEQVEREPRAQIQPQRPVIDEDHDDGPMAEDAMPMEDEGPVDVNALVSVPVPVDTGRGTGRRAGRVKTRLLGFDHGSGGSMDPFDSAKETAATAEAERFPVGWIVVLDGPGRGASFTIFTGVSQIGRGEDQAVRLDFGDNSISRSQHAMVAYDTEQRKFFLGQGGKANIVRLNESPVLSTEELHTDDKIRIGETTLWFIALCGPEFDWTDSDETNLDDAAIA